MEHSQAWTQQINAIAKCASARDKYVGMPVQKKLAAERLDLVERTIADGYQAAALIASETGINFGSINSYLRRLEDLGRITSEIGRNRIKTYEVCDE